MFIKDISRHNIKPITIELAIGLIVVIPYFLWFLWTLPTMYRSKKSIEKYAKKLFELDKKIKEKYDYIINENKIIINSKKENITLNKYNINKITFDIDSIYIFHGKKRLYIIKKRFFDNEGEFDEIILFLKEKYNGNKKNSNGS
jgi:lipopolysaccharide export LptBFGC system permease protein LptF